MNTLPAAGDLEAPVVLHGRSEFGLVKKKILPVAGHSKVNFHCFSKFMGFKLTTAPRTHQKSGQMPGFDARRGGPNPGAWAGGYGRWTAMSGTRTV
jgi:hypothetical protein